MNQTTIRWARPRLEDPRHPQTNKNTFRWNRPPFKWTRQFSDEPDHPLCNHATLRGIRPPQVYQITLRCTRSPSGVPKHFHIYQTALNCSGLPIDEPDRRQRNQNLKTSWKDLSIERGTEEWENAQEEFKLQNRDLLLASAIIDCGILRSCSASPLPSPLPDRSAADHYESLSLPRLEKALCNPNTSLLGGGSIHRQPSYEYDRLKPSRYDLKWCLAFIFDP